MQVEMAAQSVPHPDDVNLFRSQPMEYVRIVMPKEACYAAVKALGAMEKIQFADLNEDKPANLREYNSQLTRCAEVDRILRVFAEYTTKYTGLGARPPTQPAPSLLSNMPSTGMVEQSEETFESIEGEVVQRETYLKELQKNLQELLISKWSCKEKIIALEKAGPYFGHAQQTTQNPSSMGAGLLGDGGMTVGMDMATTSVLTNIVGVIPDDKINIFEKILHRATRGNIVVRFESVHEHIWDAATDTEVPKSVFVAFLQGDRTYDKVKRISDVVGAHLYEYDESQVYNDIQGAKSAFEEHNRICSASQREIVMMLNDINSKYISWTETMRRDKAVYHALNGFKYTGGGEAGEYVVAEGWAPLLDVETIRSAVTDACRSTNVAQLGATVEKSVPGHDNKCPPTYYVTNKFTYGFQAIVEAYGVARYQEHNPTPYTIVTFPFLFAVMFGDAGHGLLLLALAVYFIKNEDKLGKTKLNDMVQMPFDGRYVMLLMAIFAIYCGFLYNEFFGMPLSFFTSRWHFGTGMKMAGGYKECTTLLDTGQAKLPANIPYWDGGDDYKPPSQVKYSDWNFAKSDAEFADYPTWHDVFDDKTMLPYCTLPPKEPYPFGMDPIWKYSSAGLTYFNSLKMKMSVIFGVIQMVFGIICKATNDIVHKRPLDLWVEFVPQMVFMNGLFGYMVLLIWIKMMTSWVPADQMLPGGVPIRLLPLAVPKDGSTLLPIMPDGNFYYDLREGREDICQTGPEDSKSICFFSTPTEGVNAVQLKNRDGTVNEHWYDCYGSATFRGLPLSKPTPILPTAGCDFTNSTSDTTGELQHTDLGCVGGCGAS